MIAVSGGNMKKTTAIKNELFYGSIYELEKII